MDSINPDSRFNLIPRREAQLSQNATSRAQSSKTDASSRSSSASLKPGYSNMFDEQELERLQNNLQSIANLAGQALERIQK